MTKSEGKGKNAAGGALRLPQFCTPKQLAARKKEVEKQCGKYQFDHSWEGYPPSIAKLPLHEMSVKEGLELAEAGVRIETSKAEQWARHEAFELAHGGGEGPPFEKFHALFGKATLPMVGKKNFWQQDAVFASQRLNGMYPWFVRRVIDLASFRQHFPITDAMLVGLLPPRATLETLAGAGRLYFVSQSELDGAPPAHDHVMTAPTTLFFVNDLGQLMPLGIQLYPDSSADNPIFTPNHAPNTWLAAKIHSSCADNLVHAIYSHAILMHFVFSNVWTSANRALPPEHPVYAFLKPHFWATLFITDEVKKSMDTATGSQTSVYGTGLAGQNQMVSRLFKDFDFRDYNPNFNFEKRGVDDSSVLPEFYYRDDALQLWAADLKYVESMLGLFYSSDADVQDDFELQAWVAEMASENGGSIVGLPVNADGKLGTRDALYQIVTAVLFSVTSRHSSIENGALDYGYPPANPFLYRLAAPEKSDVNLDLAEVSRLLPPIGQVIEGWALIESANYSHKEKNRLGVYKGSFTHGWPDGARENIADWRAALDAISTAIDARNQRLAVPYTAMNPRNTFNSIWN
jgi:arachidonate 15-lipoxygenase